MTLDKDVYRELGQIEERISSLEKSMSRQCKKLDELLELKHQLDGSKRAIVSLVAIAATCGAAVSWFAANMKWN